MYFSWSPRKVPKESDLRGRYENAPPLKIPLPHRQPVFKNVPIFEHLQPKNLESFLLVDTRKSEHFRVSDGVAVGGVHRGGRIFVAPPLWRVLWLLSWRDKKVTLPHYHLQECIHYYKQLISLCRLARNRPAWAPSIWVWWNWKDMGR